MVEHMSIIKLFMLIGGHHDVTSKSMARQAH